MSAAPAAADALRASGIAWTRLAIDMLVLLSSPFAKDSISMIETTFNTGNFALKIAGEFNEDQVGKALVSALRYIVQRDGATKAYQTLGGVKGEDGKASLPDDFKREHVEWSDENGVAMQQAFEKALAPYGTFTVEASKNEGSEAASPMKRATTLVDTFLGSPMEAGYRQILGLPEGDREALIAKANEMGLGIQPPKVKKEAAEGDGQAAE